MFTEKKACVIVGFEAKEKKKERKCMLLEIR
jgi:hypothetical protein